MVDVTISNPRLTDSPIGTNDVVSIDATPTELPSGFHPDIELRLVLGDAVRESKTVNELAVGKTATLGSGFRYIDWSFGSPAKLVVVDTGDDSTLYETDLTAAFEILDPSASQSDIQAALAELVIE